MSVDIVATLNPQYMMEEEPSKLLVEIKNWILGVKPVALIHPHGFLIIPVRCQDGEDWRFHVWPRARPPMIGMPGLIHTHDKVLESRVLKGRLSNSIYSLTSVKEGGLPVYEVSYAGDKYLSSAANLLIRTKVRVAPKLIERTDLQVGESYRVDAGLFHQVDVSEGGPTCTLARMHSQSPRIIQVLGLDGYADRLEFLRAQRSADDVISLAEL
jgi:hypothetical protein